MTDMHHARRRMEEGEYTCVLCKGDRVYTSKERGVKPLVAWVESDIDFNGFSAADKVVGKGAACLYVLLGVSSVYAHVISSPALELFKKHGICVEYTSVVSRIINRAGDGICPFESAVLPIEDLADAYKAIRKTMKTMHIEL